MANRAYTVPTALDDYYGERDGGRFTSFQKSGALWVGLSHVVSFENLL